MESSSSGDFLLALSLPEKRKRKYWVYPILKTGQEQEEFHLLMKELRNRFQVYFRMPVVQVDVLLAILETHIKKTTNVCKLIDPEQGLVGCLRQEHTQRLPLYVSSTTLLMIWTDARSE